MKTVQETITQLLYDFPEESGHIGIFDEDDVSKLGSPRVEYSNGRITMGGMSEEVLSSMVEKAETNTYLGTINYILYTIGA